MWLITFVHVVVRSLQFDTEKTEISWDVPDILNANLRKTFNWTVNGAEKYAIELKYPLNGQYPERMYSFAKDIAFMEQLVESGFDGAYCVTLVNDRNFYSGKKTDGIYSYFRANGSVCGVIVKLTGKSEETIELKKSYSIKWEGLMEKMKYYIVDINEGV